MQKKITFYEDSVLYKEKSRSGFLLLKRSIYSLLFILLCFITSNIEAQTTSSGVEGKLLDEKGEPIVGATIVATHLPTGTKYIVTSSSTGDYTLANIKPGGPYKISITFIGYKEQVYNDVNIPLGEVAVYNSKMVEETIKQEEIVVTGDKSRGKTGAGTNISKEQIQTLPTITRSINDMTRLTPQSSNNSFNGTSFRYNNITLDGAINNDAIGFSPSLGGQSGTSGTPGSSTRNNPFSLDAIQEVQVAIAPYDVKMGNFTGGSVNAITRSGTNTLTGSIYSFGRNSTITGKSVDGNNTKMPSSYHDYQLGFRLGGALVKDKLFFFTNAEITRRDEPVFYGASSTGSFLSQYTANRIADSLASPTFLKAGSTPYQVNLGNANSNQNYNIHSYSNKIFGRIDWNINDKHQLAIRHNYSGSEATNLERDARTFRFASMDYTQHNVLNSTVLELKSRFSNTIANNLILGYTNIHDYRNPIGQPFPQIQINGINGGTVLAGTDREATIFNTKQNTFEFTNNVNIYKGKHAFTIGTHNEFYKIDYGFINSWNGRIDYKDTTSFFNNQPSRVRQIYNNGSDNSYGYNYNHPSASFNIALLSAYVQDDWKMTDRFKLMPGIRVDYVDLPKSPGSSPLATATYNNGNYDYSNSTYSSPSISSSLNHKLFSQPYISPRIGFNWDIKGDKAIVIRGGTGKFTGRVPFAWLGYAYYNNSVNFGAVDYKNPGTFQLPSDPTLIHTSVPASKQNTELDAFDPKFKMPQNWRSSLAVDLKLPGGYKLTLEGIYTKVLQDVKFQNINIKDSAVGTVSVAPGVTLDNYNRGKVNNGFSNVYLITNTNKGYRYSLTAQLSKKYNWGMSWMAAYTYGMSKDISNGIRNSPESNWQLNPALVSNNPQLGYSNFDIRHRIVATATYKKDWSEKLTSYVSMVFTAQSGSPYTFIYGGASDLTGAGQQQTLMYVPKDQTDIELVNITDSKGNITSTAAQQWSQLDSYISGNKYLNSRRGKFTERNAARTPWNTQLDLRLMQDINFQGVAKNLTNDADVNSQLKRRKHTIQITFDVINFTHLINKNWGNSYFTSNTTNSCVSTGLTPTGKIDAVTGLETFTFTQPTIAPYSIDQLASRWQGQLGLRYLF